MKENKLKSEFEDECSKSTDEDSLKKVKKKESTSKCSYCSKGFHPKKKFFNKKRGVMSWLLDKNDIEVPDELEKPIEPS